jgi:hypothetical protein
MSGATLPTKVEIAQLPRWARVAFAARCARRALSFFHQDWPDAPKMQVELVTEAIESAERAAEFAESTFTFESYGAAKAAYAAGQHGRAGYAARAARSAAASVHNETAPEAIAYAAHAGASIDSIRMDYDRLLHLANLNGWTDDTPVPDSVFESSDPQFEAALEALLNPSPDPLETDEQIVLSLRAFAEPGVSASTLAEHLLATYKALNEYTLAKYGKHLSRGEFRRLVYKHAGVPA